MGFSDSDKVILPCASVGVVYDKVREAQHLPPHYVLCFSVRKKYLHGIEQWHARNIAVHQSTFQCITFDKASCAANSHSIMVLLSILYDRADVNTICNPEMSQV